MFLERLYTLYHALLAEEKVPVAGRSVQRISFCLVINPDVSFYIDDVRMPNAKGKMFPIDYLVLGDTKPPGSGINPCFLWDNAAYLLGYTDDKEESKVKAERALKSFVAGRDKYLAVESEIKSEAYSLFCRFLERWDITENREMLSALDYLSHNGLIRIQGSNSYLHQDEAVIQWWNTGGREKWQGAGAKPQDAVQGQCLITGNRAPLARLHEPSIKGVMGSQPGGAKIVSFNNKAFESYAKDQSLNSPVSEEAAFAYCNALNYLLTSKTHRLRIGDTTVVFWTGAPKQNEEDIMAFSQFLDPDLTPEEKPSSEHDALRKRVEKTLDDLALGFNPKDVLDNPQVPFYILGLSGNVARLSVRFYLETHLGDLLTKIQQHNDALSLERRHEKFKDPLRISPFRIMRETVRDSKDIPPIYSGALLRSILNSSPYPDVIAQGIIRRIRVDGFINYVRCAFIKAWLSRRNPQKHYKTMLDKENKQIGYVLGRIFALMQKTQNDVLPNLNRTMQDAFYASASASPQRVFPRLLRLHGHHVSKLEGGFKVGRIKLMQSIMELIDVNVGFPKQLDLEQQGLFALGMYHQTQNFYKTKDDSNK